MNNKLKLYCCNQEAKYVDHGPNLQYYFCDNCRKEVCEPIRLDTPSDDPYADVYDKTGQDDIWATLSTLVYTYQDVAYDIHPRFKDLKLMRQEWDTAGLSLEQSDLEHYERIYEAERRRRAVAKATP